MNKPTEDIANRRAAIERERRALEARETVLLVDELAGDEAAHTALVERCRSAKDDLELFRSEMDHAQAEFRSANNAVRSANF